MLIEMVHMGNNARDTASAYEKSLAMHYVHIHRMTDDILSQRAIYISFRCVLPLHIVASDDELQPHLDCTFERLDIL